MMKLLRLALIACFLFFATGLSGCEPAETAPDDTQTPVSGDLSVETGDSMQPQPDTQHAPETSQPTKLQLGFIFHLEGWKVDQREVFEMYINKLRGYSQLFRTYGALPTWEAANLIKPSQQFGVNILKELQDAGDGVGVHADLGGQADKKGYTQQQFVEELKLLKTGMQQLGVSVRHVSGVCSSLDWVSAAKQAGFELVNGVVAYCLLSLPNELIPEQYRDCDNPAACHDPYPTEPAQKIHAWRMLDGSNWTSPNPRGNVWVLPGNGALPCLAEHYEQDSPTKCIFDDQDVSEAFKQIDTALSLVQPGKVNSITFVWSLGQSIDTKIFEQFLSRLKRDYVDAGKLEWKTVPQILDLYNAN